MEHNRRDFLQFSAASVAAVVASDLGAAGNGRVPLRDVAGKAWNRLHLCSASAGQSPQKRIGKPLRLGLIVAAGKDPDSAIKKVHDLGLPTAQVIVDGFDDEAAKQLQAAIQRYTVEVTSMVVSGPGPEIYDFYQGPLTIGLVPRKYRSARIARLKRGSDFAKRLGIPAVQTHCGFIPENPNDPVYKDTIKAIREVANYCSKNGQNFRYETGQETPVTLLRAIQDVGLDNQGINFDCANLILYGKANPVDALDLLGPHVQGIHAKDGLYPTDPRNLGKEVPIGQGRVDFPRIIRHLKELDYAGAITIEREISGPEQLEDVRAEKTYLEKLIHQPRT
jgi:L-ribulose-5-phosphate 3-epimerase